MSPARVLVIGIGNPLRGDDGIGPWLVERALPRWLAAAGDRGGEGLRGARATVALRSVHQLLPELALELAGVQQLLLVDAWAPAAFAPARPWLGPLDGRTMAGVATQRPPREVPGWSAAAGSCGWVSHGLQPQDLLALAAALGVEPPRTDGLLVPGRCWLPAAASGSGRFSPTLRRQLPHLRRLLLRWLQEATGGAPGCPLRPHPSRSPDAGAKPRLA